jgi:hypothetical protein
MRAAIITSRANFNYLQHYYRRNEDAHYVDECQARADNAVTEELHRQVVAVDVRVRAVQVCVGLTFDVGHFYGAVYEPYASESPEQALRITTTNSHGHRQPRLRLMSFTLIIATNSPSDKMKKERSTPLRLIYLLLSNSHLALPISAILFKI